MIWSRILAWYWRDLGRLSSGADCNRCWVPLWNWMAKFRKLKIIKQCDFIHIAALTCTDVPWYRGTEVLASVICDATGSANDKLEIRRRMKRRSAVRWLATGSNIKYGYRSKRLSINRTCLGLVIKWFIVLAYGLRDFRSLRRRDLAIRIAVIIVAITDRVFDLAKHPNLKEILDWKLRYITEMATVIICLTYDSILCAKPAGFDSHKS